MAAEDYFNEYYWAEDLEEAETAAAEDAAARQPPRGPRQMTYPHNENDNRRGNARGNNYDPRDPRNADPRGGDPRNDPRMRWGDGTPSDPRNDPRDQRGAAPPSQQQRSAAPDDGETLFPEGDFVVRPVKHKIGFAGTGTEQIGVRLQVMEGPQKGKYIVWYGSFTDASEDITIKAMRALGFEGDNIYDCSSMYANPEHTAIAVVAHEQNQNGKLVSKVKWINGADVAMKEEMNDAELRSFAQRMRAKFARHGGASSQPQRSTGPAPGPAAGPQNGQQQRRGYDPRQEPPPADDPPWGRQ